jgi:hypothetical protein
MRPQPAHSENRLWLAYTYGGTFAITDSRLTSWRRELHREHRVNAARRGSIAKRSNTSPSCSRNFCDEKYNTSGAVRSRLSRVSTIRPSRRAAARSSPPPIRASKLTSTPHSRSHRASRASIRSAAKRRVSGFITLSVELYSLSHRTGRSVVQLERLCRLLLAIGELERRYPGAPASVASGLAEVFIRVPEGAVVSRIDRHCAVVAPSLGALLRALGL